MSDLVKLAMSVSSVTLRLTWPLVKRKMLLSHGLDTSRDFHSLLPNFLFLCFLHSEIFKMAKNHATLVISNGKRSLSFIQTLSQVCVNLSSCWGFYLYFFGSRNHKLSENREITWQVCIFISTLLKWLHKWYNIRKMLPI